MDKKQNSAAKKLEELWGVKIQLPQETTADLMREAQSVLNYFESRGETFYYKTCKTCKEQFAYAWNVSSIAYCGIFCMAIALQEIGIEWDNTKPPAERWGRYVPAVVPPEALSILQEILDAQEAQPDNTSS